MDYQTNIWHRIDPLTPREIDIAIPRRVLRIGEHIGRTITLDKDHWIVVCYKQDGDPEKYMIVQNPHVAGKGA